ncbi:MAG: hypothetical protein ACM359_21225 [Bacillota bacterium]
MQIAKWLMAAMMVNLVTVGLAIGAADHHAATSPTEHAAQAIQPDPHPLITGDATWVRPMIAAIAALFLAAIPVGLIVRANMPQQMPTTHSHDEPPGSTAHDAHGSHGTGDPH